MGIYVWLCEQHIPTNDEWTLQNVSVEGVVVVCWCFFNLQFFFFSFLKNS